jgi:hypothetical protein
MSPTSVTSSLALVSCSCDVLSSEASEYSFALARPDCLTPFFLATDVPDGAFLRSFLSLPSAEAWPLSRWAGHMETKN